MSLSDKRKVVALVVMLPLFAALATALLLTGVLGPSDWGVRCARLPVRECRVLQTRFFGLLGNSDFAIPEEDIRGVKTVRLLPRAGARASVTYTVNLILDPKWPYPSYPVLSYELESQADASTRKLNAYLQDSASQSIELREDLLTPVLVKGVAPIGLVVGLCGVLWWLRRKRSQGITEAITP